MARKFVYYFIGGKQLFSDGLNIIFPLQHLILSFAQNSRGAGGQVDYYTLPCV